MPNKPEPLPLNEPLLRKKLDRSTKIKFALISLAIGAMFIYVVVDVALHGPLMTLLSNRDQLVATVESFGAFGPLLYILLQIAQTVAAPIPGQIVGSVGGFLFGTWGILWTLIGSLIGCWIVFLIARRFGRPLLEKIFKKSVIDKFDFIINAKGSAFIIFAVFLLPGFPDDVVCYIAGLTKLPISRLMLLVGIGRFPTIVLTNFLGAGISDNIGLVAVISVLAMAFLGLVVWKREWIMQLLKGEHKDEQKDTRDESLKDERKDGYGNVGKNNSKYKDNPRS